MAVLKFLTEILQPAVSKAPGSPESHVCDSGARTRSQMVAAAGTRAGANITECFSGHTPRTAWTLAAAPGVWSKSSWTPACSLPEGKAVPLAWVRASTPSWVTLFSQVLEGQYPLCGWGIPRGLGIKVSLVLTYFTGIVSVYLMTAYEVGIGENPKKNWRTLGEFYSNCLSVRHFPVCDAWQVELK